MALLGLVATAALSALAPAGASARPIADTATPANARLEGHALPAHPNIYVQPRALAPVSEQSAARSTSTYVRPVATTVAGNGTGIDWETVALGIVGSLLAVGGIAALTNRRSRRQRGLRPTH